MSDDINQKILFINMPWATTQRPSIALGILAQLSNDAKIPVKTLYPNLDMSALIGFENYARFSNERALYGFSEHIFAADLFGKEPLDSDNYVISFHKLLEQDEEVKNWNVPFTDIDYLFTLRDSIIPRFLDSVTTRIVQESPTVLGLSSTFNQVMSCLALAHRVKQKYPKINIIAGGACFHGMMGLEYHRAFPHILDYVFNGEAEEAFREFLQRLKTGTSLHGIAGVSSFVGNTQSFIPGEPLYDMNLSPLPDYDDFFLESDRVKTETGKMFNIDVLPFESSRGCWWGQKRHCLFCGNNEDMIVFRSKDVDRIIKDILQLSARYRLNKLSATDWVISNELCDNLFDRLIKLDLDLELFYEARVNMKKRQVIQMKDAGITSIQPGIESLSTPILKLMNKGTTALQNIQFLRWCKEARINASYNILGGVPKERIEYYRDMSKLITKLYHLQPPHHNLQYIEMHRFSPFFEEQEKYGIEHITVRADYTANFPPGIIDLDKICYFFNITSSQKLPESDYAHPVTEAISAWKSAQDQKVPAVYEYAIGPSFLRIIDTRTETNRVFSLTDIYQDITLLCDEIQTLRSLCRDLLPVYPAEVKDGTINRVIDELIEHDILVQEGTHLLTLPIGKKPRTTEELRDYVLS